MTARWSRLAGRRDGLDLWAYAVTVGGMLLRWLPAVVTISHTRASPEA